LWTSTTNQIWIKHFDMEMERGNPSTKRRLETRLIVRNATGVYGVSYQWNTNQTDATLVPDVGADFDLSITNSGSNSIAVLPGGAGGAPIESPAGLSPTALALADFHAPGSMVWSREALPTYLYGILAHVEERPSGCVAVGIPVEQLIGEGGIPAGLFRDPAMAWLSAVIQQCRNAREVQSHGIPRRLASPWSEHAPPGSLVRSHARRVSADAV